jgi:hypothetical protein
MVIEHLRRADWRKRLQAESVRAGVAPLPYLAPDQMR